MKKIIAICLMLMAVACTDADQARWAAKGKSGHITCYSAGKVIYDGESKGHIKTEPHSDGWYFEDREGSKLVRVNGDCVIIN